MIKKNIHIYPTKFFFESRIYKISKGLIDHKIVDQIELVGIGDSHLPEFENIDHQRRIWRVPLYQFSFLEGRIRRLLRYLLWIFKVVWHYRNQHLTMVNCHSIHDLPMGVILKKLRKCILIYDTHELETERNGLTGWLQKLARMIERMSIPHVDHLFAASDSFAQWYKDHYHLQNVTALKNIPVRHQRRSRVAEDFFRQFFNIPDNHLIFIYQGALIYGRSIPLILSVFKRVKPDKHVVFMGYGEYAATIKDDASQANNIHFHPAVPLEEVLDYTEHADVGLSLIEKVCLSYYLCLPNKVFEYILSGIPCIVSNFPDMAALIDRCNCGWKIGVSQTDLLDLINCMSVGQIREKKKLVQEANREFKWSDEEKKMALTYQAIFSAGKK